MSTEQLPLWVIYRHPSDFPAHYVSREWDAMTNTACGTCMLALTLDEVRAMLPRGLTRIERCDGDEPAIVERWL